MSETLFDLVVLGGGPGGYVAAIRASQLGMKVAVVERENLGGICLNWGCIPTKALLRSAEVKQLLHRIDSFGLGVGEIRFDLEKIVGRSRKIAAQLSGGVKFLMKKHAITVFDGFGALAGTGAGGRRLEVARDGKAVATLAAPHVIIATGARARMLPGLECDGKLVWSYREAMMPTAIPESLLVVGSGAIGIEFASFYHAMGARVTVLEVMDRILPAEDEEISALARKAFEKQGMGIHTNATVKAFDRNPDGVTATVVIDGQPRKLTAGRVIMAVGITGNVEGFGLEKTRAKVEAGHIAVDAMLRTHEPGLYAIGDVAGAPWLAHKAMHEGVICVEAIHAVARGEPLPQALDLANIPGCTYCMPQVASVGLTEKRARALGHEVKVGRSPCIANGKAVAMGETEGLVKTVFDAGTGELLGAHMIGAEVTELVGVYGLARLLEATEGDMINAVFPHPTLSEAMHESVLDAFGRALHF